MRRLFANTWAVNAFVALVYLAGALLGLRVAMAPGTLSPVWPASGWALGALLLLGTRCWPGVFVGSLLGDLHHATPVSATVVLSIGNTLEPLIAAWLLKRWRLRPGLDRVREVVALALFGAVIGPAVAATLGTWSLWLAGDLHRGAAFSWFVWWVSDAIGVLTVAPAVLVLAAPERERSRGGRLEAAGLALVFVVTMVVMFGDPFTGAWRELPVSFFLLPVLLWAGLRFGPLGAAIGILLAASVAQVGTALGHGPFARTGQFTGLLFLQIFLGIEALVALTLAAAEAERRSATMLRERFMALASHELRTPLTPLKLTFQRLTRSDGRVSAQRRGELLAAGERQVDRLARLADNIIDATRLATDRLQLQREPVDLAALAREITEQYGPQLASLGCPIELHADEPVVGRWDRIRLEQVVANLVSNAAKYGAGRPIEIRVGRSRDNATLEVRDHGVGIASEDQPHVFERYGMLRRESAGGLGLGLFISREIIEALGGVISVSSSPGSGASFQVELPLGVGTA